MYIYWRGSVISLRNNVYYKQLAGNIVTFCRKHAGSGRLIFFRINPRIQHVKIQHGMKLTLNDNSKIVFNADILQQWL